MFYYLSTINSSTNIQLPLLVHKLPKLLFKFKHNFLFIHTDYHSITQWVYCSKGSNTPILKLLINFITIKEEKKDIVYY